MGGLELILFVAGPSLGFLISLTAWATNASEKQTSSRV